MADANEEVADYEEQADGEYNEEDYAEQGAEGEEELDPGAIQKRVQEMEDELHKLTSMQEQVSGQLSSTADIIDENSIYVGQVDYQATPEELQAHFAPCGTINRVTIVCDKITGQPKGFAYVQFADKEGVEKALKLDDSTFKGRQLKVLPKRQNIPVMRGGGRGRGRGFGGRGFRGGRGGYAPARGYYGRGGRFGGRGRGRGGYSAGLYQSYY